MARAQLLLGQTEAVRLREDVREGQGGDIVELRLDKRLRLGKFTARGGVLAGVGAHRPIRPLVLRDAFQVVRKARKIRIDGIQAVDAGIDVREALAHLRHLREKAVQPRLQRGRPVRLRATGHLLGDKILHRRLPGEDAPALEFGLAVRGIHQHLACVEVEAQGAGREFGLALRRARGIGVPGPDVHGAAVEVVHLGARTRPAPFIAPQPGLDVLPLPIRAAPAFELHAEHFDLRLVLLGIPRHARLVQRDPRGGEVVRRGLPTRQVHVVRRRGARGRPEDVERRHHGDGADNRHKLHPEMGARMRDAAVEEAKVEVDDRHQVAVHEHALLPLQPFAVDERTVAAFRVADPARAVRMDGDGRVVARNERVVKRKVASRVEPDREITRHAALRDERNQAAGLVPIYKLQPVFERRTGLGGVLPGRSLVHDERDVPEDEEIARFDAHGTVEHLAVAIRPTAATQVLDEQSVALPEQAGVLAAHRTFLRRRAQGAVARAPDKQLVGADGQLNRRNRVFADLEYDAERLPLHQTPPLLMRW